MTPLARFRLQRDVEAVHRLGARVTFELLVEIGKRTGGPDVVEAVVSEFAGIDHDVLVALGGHRFPAGPIRSVS